MNRHEHAVHEARSVLAEWQPDTCPSCGIDPGEEDGTMSIDIVAVKIIQRPVAKGVIQSTDPDDLVAVS